MKAIELTITKTKQTIYINVEKIFYFGKSGRDPDKTTIDCNDNSIDVDQCFMDVCDKLKEFPYFKPFFNTKSKSICMVNMNHLIGIVNTEAGGEDADKDVRLLFTQGYSHSVRESYEEACALLNEVLNGQ
jgi:hypothetical protein